MKNLFLSLLLLTPVISWAVENKTKLVVGITINHFYPEWLPMYGNDLSEGGLKRLTHGGRGLTADYHYFYSQTGVDQASLYSGVVPAEHGVVAHDWYDRLKNRRQNAVASSTFKEIGGTGNKDGLCPGSLQMLTLGCAMKNSDLFSKVYSISMNGEEAVLSGGSCADMALWFSEDNGKWVSSTYYADSLPDWMTAYNAKMESDFYIRRGWMPLVEEESNPVTLKLKNKVGLSNSFFYDIAQAKRNYNTYRVLKATPYANTMVADLAKQVVESQGLGRDNDADLLALNFSFLDYMNRDFDVHSKEFQDVLIRFDKDIEALFSFLDNKVGKDNYTVFFTVSEARELLPEELGKMRLSGEYFSIFKAVALLKSYLNLVYGDGEWIVDYDPGQIYLNRGLIESRKMSLKDVQDKVADFMIEFEGVSRVYTAYSLSRNSFPEGVDLLVQNSFSGKRSGDVLFTLRPAWMPDIKEREDNFFRYSKRDNVPLFFYGAGVRELKAKECRIEDVLPSLCEILNIPVPYTARGKSVFK